MAGQCVRPHVDGATEVDALSLTERIWMGKQRIRTRGWKRICALEPNFHSLPPAQLSDLWHDPTEQRTLAAERPGGVGELTGRLEAWGSRWRVETSQPDPLAEQRITLRRIGAMKTGDRSTRRFYAAGGPVRAAQS